MTRLSSLLAASTLAASPFVAGLAPAALAQAPFAAAKAAAHKAADAASAHVEAEQRPDGPARPAGAVHAVRAVSAGEVRRDTVPSHRPSGLTIATRSDTGAPPRTIMREEYAYSRDGRRDPFFSLLATSELRPTLSDLRLTGILFDHSGTRSVATLRDLATNAQYRVFVGSTLGRMRVSTIRMKAVIFTIDEFGTTRQDSLYLGDSTRTRVK